MVQDYLGMNPKGSIRLEWGGATGGECFQAGYEAVASGRMDVCLTAGYETMSRVQTWKGNEFIALASDTNYDFPLGGFYTGYYALMVIRHIHEYLRKTRFAHVTDEREAQRLAIAEGSRIMSLVSVKNHLNALHNPYAQYPNRLTVDDVLKSEMISYPLTREQICTMSDGAAVTVLCTGERAKEFTDKPVEITGVGTGTDTMRLADRPFGKVPLLPHESEKDYEHLPYPGVHSFRAGRSAGKEAFAMAGIENPKNDLDFIELHDAYASSEIQTYEDLGLCRYGEGYAFTESGAPFLKDFDYGFPTPKAGEIPVNPSGGLIACGHPVGATGLMQAVFAFWQLQGTIGKHFGDPTLQIRNAKRGAIHSHAGTGSAVTVSVMERGF
jgi:acetyl-CoA C-acetyltransferase